MALILLQIGILYFLGHVFAYGFQRYRIPDILLFTIIGLLLGPIFKLSSPEDFGHAGKVLSSLALIVILFEGGTTLDFRKVAEATGLSLALALSTMLVTVLVFSLLAWPILGSVENAILVGVIVGGTSSAVVIPMVTALGLGERVKNALILESALTDVLCIVFTMGLVQAFVRGGVQVQGFVEKILLSFLVAIIIGTVAGLLWARLRHLLQAQFATIAVALIVYGVTELVGYSGPIAVMSMGIWLTQAQHLFRKETVAPLSEFESNFYKEMVFVLKVFFFIYLGISIEAVSFGLVLLSMGALIFVIGIRFVVLRFVAHRSGSPEELTFAGLLVPKGLAAAVLAGVPVQMGMAGGEQVQKLVFVVVIVSIVAVSILIPAVKLAPVSRIVTRFFATTKG
ncbi:MAG: cation:proton antiporter [Bdellovibrionales bacterium]|nr:cation:proton antiporter [Bdellovibrionales bacterium]